MPDRSRYLGLFPEHKRRARAELIDACGLGAASSISSVIRKHHSIENAVIWLPEERRLDRYVTDYVGRVIDFKIANGIGPLDRVEPPKIAALLISMLYQKDLSELFLLSGGRQLTDSAYPRVTRGTFFMRLVMSFLGLHKDFIRTSLAQDLQTVLVTEDVSNVRLVSVMLKAIFEMHGGRQYGLTD